TACTTRAIGELRRKYEEARSKARGTDTDGHTPSPPLPTHHNAWGGFISRSGTHAVPERSKSPRYLQERSKSSTDTSSSVQRVEGTKHTIRKIHTSRSRSRSHSRERTRKAKKTQRRQSGS
ncbi:hypothetical protein PV328_012229, partial [Microctonus aethiopoides]